MFKYFLIAVLLVQICVTLNGQSVKVFYEAKTSGYVLYATNEEFYPTSVSLDLSLTNLTFSRGEKRLFVIPAKANRFKIGELTATFANDRYTFSYKYISAMGDVTIVKYDTTIQYDLPFQKDKSYKVFQGYDGKFSHQNEKSLDFTMPEGSEIMAAREGVVVQVVENNTESCPREECNKYNNLITIMHSDGTFASYIHIKYNGALFNPGDKVKRGDVIALSGNVGWSSGPHLHFMCFTGRFAKRNTIETKFKIETGETASLLSEGEKYKRSY